MKTNNGHLPAMPIELSGFGRFEPEFYTGISKREQFAAMAMQGFISNTGATKSPEELALWSVQAADALLKQLEA